MVRSTNNDRNLPSILTAFGGSGFSALAVSSDGSTLASATDEFINIYPASSIWLPSYVLNVPTAHNPINFELQEMICPNKNCKCKNPLPPYIKPTLKKARRKFGKRRIVYLGVIQDLCFFGQNNEFLVGIGPFFLLIYDLSSMNLNPIISVDMRYFGLDSVSYPHILLSSFTVLNIHRNFVYRNELLTCVDFMFSHRPYVPTYYRVVFNERRWWVVDCQSTVGLIRKESLDDDVPYNISNHFKPETDDNEPKNVAEMFRYNPPKEDEPWIDLSPSDNGTTSNDIVKSLDGSTKNGINCDINNMDIYEYVTKREEENREFEEAIFKNKTVKILRKTGRKSKLKSRPKMPLKQTYLTKQYNPNLLKNLNQDLDNINNELSSIVRNPFDSDYPYFECKSLQPQQVQSNSHVNTKFNDFEKTKEELEEEDEDLLQDDLGNIVDDMEDKDEKRKESKKGGDYISGINVNSVFNKPFEVRSIYFPFCLLKNKFTIYKPISLSNFTVDSEVTQKNTREYYLTYNQEFVFAVFVPISTIVLVKFSVETFFHIENDLMKSTFLGKTDSKILADLAISNIPIRVHMFLSNPRSDQFAIIVHDKFYVLKYTTSSTVNTKLKSHGTVTDNSLELNNGENSEGVSDTSGYKKELKLYEVLVEDDEVQNTLKIYYCHYDPVLKLRYSLGCFSKSNSYGYLAMCTNYSSQWGFQIFDLSYKSGVDGLKLVMDSSKCKGFIQMTWVPNSNKFLFISRLNGELYQLEPKSKRNWVGLISNFKSIEKNVEYIEPEDFFDEKNSKNSTTGALDKYDRLNNHSDKTLNKDYVVKDNRLSRQGFSSVRYPFFDPVFSILGDYWDSCEKQLDIGDFDPEFHVNSPELAAFYEKLTDSINLI
ncbi:uncharacterized protein TA18845 [Theileria annulata]|uniref:Uncharacterized protein n=1 Tax=Theileria annulata TaxID=5874 RepID=Q4UBB9_THEAN|nr:uncharacterized protein TA18845 [Theileria annulata]CAI75882.1 hypothetical protein TA18845 [Theileria annulata]|eukprot:XP_955358.1 hypothetical protein TA18845 [Theileria annulata]